jgi:hypothetical protein
MAGKKVTFDRENKICEGYTAYFEDWMNLVEKNKSLTLSVEALKNLTTEYYGKKEDSIKKIHTFLDFYNDLIKNQFFNVINLMYPDFWNFGIAIGEYSETKLSYVMYPITKDENEIQIKKLEDTDVGLSLINLHGFSFRNSNPIMDSPQGLAIELIVEQMKSVLKERFLRATNPDLQNEVLLSMAQRYIDILGLESKETYSSEELIFAFKTYLPNWLSEARNCLLTNPKITQNDLAKLKSDVLDIDYLYQNSIDKINTINEILMQKSQLIEPEIYYISCYDTRLSKVFLILDKLTGTETFTEPEYAQFYDSKAFSDLSDKEKLNKTFDSIYEIIPTVYNDFIQFNFPSLFDKIDFYGEADLVLCSLSALSGDDIPFLKPNKFLETTPYGARLLTNWVLSSHIMYLELNDESHVKADKSTKCIPYKDMPKISVGKNRFVEFEGEKYVIVRTKSTALIDESFSLLTIVYSILSDRLESFFKSEYGYELQFRLM